MSSLCLYNQYFGTSYAEEQTHTETKKEKLGQEGFLQILDVMYI